MKHVRWLGDPNVCSQNAKHLRFAVIVCNCNTSKQDLWTSVPGAAMLSVSFRRLAVLVLLSAATAHCLSTELSPKPIIIDTDIFSDVDDIGAIAVANTLHNCGIVDLRAVIINTPSEYGALAASVSTLDNDPRTCNRESVRRHVTTYDYLLALLAKIKGEPLRTQ